MTIKILLIEDNPDHVMLTKRVLQRSGKDCEVESVTGGEAGINKIIEQNYNLVLCDYHLPDLSALEILKRLKEKGKDLVASSV